MIEEFIKQLKKNNLQFEQIASKLILVRNFLAKDELNQINNIVLNASQKDWEHHYLSSVSRFCMQKFGRDDVDNLIAEGKFEITQGWSDKTLSLFDHHVWRPVFDRLSSMLSCCDTSIALSGISTVQRLPPGTELKTHVDQHTDPSIRYATIIYLNDDYNAGEVFFRNLNIELKPKPGDLLFFPGDDEYEHGVKHVTDGPVRYVMVGFVKEIDFYEKNKY